MFWTKTKQAKKTTTAPRRAVVEHLEGRQFFSAGPVPTVEQPVAQSYGFAAVMEEVVARVAAAKTGGTVAVTPVVKASKAPINAPIFKTQDVFGQWVGTFTSARTGIEAAMGINFNIRHPANKNFQTQAYTGTFNLSAMIGEANAVSTVTMTRNNDMRMLVLTDKATASFNGALSQNGKMINGRYTALVNGRYTVGSFVLVKVS